MPSGESIPFATDRLVLQVAPAVPNHFVYVRSTYDPVRAAVSLDLEEVPAWAPKCGIRAAIHHEEVVASLAVQLIRSSAPNERIEVRSPKDPVVVRTAMHEISAPAR